MSSDTVNWLRDEDGQVRAVCEFCGVSSAPVPAEPDGRPDLLRMPYGWSEAPFPADYRHRDGSTGSLYACPDCNAKLRAGARLANRCGYQLHWCHR